MNGDGLRFLLDRNVLGELEDPQGDRNVRAWAATVRDRQLFIPAVAVYEAAKGFARLRRRRGMTQEEARFLDRNEEAFRAVLDAFEGRIAGIGRREAERWGTLVGAKEKDVMDRAVAAIVIEGGFVVATRNVADFRGLPVRLVNPFLREPVIVEPD